MERMVREAMQNKGISRPAALKRLAIIWGVLGVITVAIGQLAALGGYVFGRRGSEIPLDVLISLVGVGFALIGVWALIEMLRSS